MATSSADVASLPPEEAMELALRTDPDPGSSANPTLSQEEVESELTHADELPHSDDYTLPQKIASLPFKTSLDEIEPPEAFKMLRQNKTTTTHSWEVQVEECVKGEDDDFWTQVSYSRKKCDAT